MPRLCGEVRGRRSFVVVARPAGDGAWMLSFYWNGRTMQFDGATHLAAVRTPDEARAAMHKAFAAR